MNARRLATALVLNILVATGSVSADGFRREFGTSETRGEGLTPSLFDRLQNWLENWLLATEAPPLPDPDEQPTEGPQSDPNG